MVQKFFLITILTIFFTSCTENNNSIQEAICIPEKLLLTDNSNLINTIEEISKKKNLNYADCIQIAILYARYDEPQDDIIFFLNKSFDYDSLKYCETMCYLKDNTDWELVINYPQIINSIMLKCKDCQINQDEK